MKINYIPANWHKIELWWDDIANVPVADALNVSDWNTLFDLPHLGYYGVGEFIAAAVEGNIVTLTYRGVVASVKANLFYDPDTETGNEHLLKVKDNGCFEAIGEASFFNCPNLNEVSFKKCVSTGVSSLANTPGLQTIDMPELNYGGDGSFSYCGATTITLQKLNYAGPGCFSGASATVYNLPIFLYAGDYCFSNCSVMEACNAPNLETAGEGCFSYCTGMTEFSYPHLVNIGSNCFSYCIAGSYDFPLLSSIGAYGLAYLISPTYINLPNWLTGGTQTPYNDTFNYVTSNTLTLRTNSYVLHTDATTMASIAYLQANNTVTIIEV
jgi:hypothetical protein